MRGENGAVEANARVRITNLTAGERTGSTVRTLASATASGSFSTSIPAQLGDRIELIAIDAADNESPASTVTAGPEITSLVIRTVGDVPQAGVVGRQLVDPLQVQVTAPPPHGEIRGLNVTFEVRSGGGTVARSTVVTNASGIATTTFTLGPEVGTQEVVARLQVDPTKEVTIPSLAVETPRIDSITPDEAEPGQTVTIRGANFSPVARHNVVQFGSETANVSEASATRLVVQVPLFALESTVTVSLTGVSSSVFQAFDLLPVPVDAPAVGNVDLVTLTQGDGTIELPFESAGTEYVVILESTSPTPGTFSTTLRADGATLSTASAAGGLVGAGVRSASRAGESLIREMDRKALHSLPWRVRNDPPRGALDPAQDGCDAPDPALGVSCPFNVVNTAGGLSLTDGSKFESVTARLRYKGDNTLVFVDDRVSGSTISDAMVTSIGNRFDDQIYPRDVAAFGEPSDEDGNGRVIILLSPTVNSLTTQEIFDGGSRIVGFFFGSLDLLADPVRNPFSNDAEVFYSIVPDPDAVFGAAPSETGDAYVDLVTGVTAHEFQHMISFNWHVCQNLAPCQRRGQEESLWLDEGLSHMAEAINGLHVQNQARGALFLGTPHATTLVGGGDMLDERGAAYYFVQYLVDRFGEGVLKRLVAEGGLARRTGIANVDVATDVAFTFLFHQWAAALLLDGPEIANDPVYEFASRSVRNDFEFGKQLLNANPNTPDRITTEFLDIDERDILDVRNNGLIVIQRGTSPAYVRVTSPGRVNAPVRIDGAINSELQVTIVRTK